MTGTARSAGLKRQGRAVGALCAASALCLTLAGCTKPAADARAAGAPASGSVPGRPDGYVHYAGGGSYACGPAPLSLDGSHARLELSGVCRIVRVTGEHNDVILGVAPGGTVDVTGAHNDIWWHPTGRGRLPDLRNSGSSNTFHREGG